MRARTFRWLAALLGPTAGALAQSPAPALRHFSEAPADTAAIAFNIGDRFAGPGALAFGRSGARRQIVLPEGEWIVLAGADWSAALTGNQTVARMQAALSTVVFGRFAGDRLVTMLRYSANTRPAPTLMTGGAIGATWPDAERCDVAAPTRLFHERQQPDPFREDCLSIGLLPDPLAEPWAANVEARRSLKRLGGRAAGAAVATTLAFSEMRRYGYLGVTRIDWPADTGAETFGASMRSWAADYRKAALQGYRSDYPGDELKPLR